jgi:hypothetical protein
MTTFNILSTFITNRDATPKVLSDPFVGPGAIQNCEGYVQTNGAADAAGSLYRMVSVPSDARIESISLQADALGTSCALDIGVYWPTYIPTGSGLSAANQSKQVLNASNFFASALGCSNTTAVTNVINSSGLNTIVKQELPLWSAIGLATDPMIELDIVVSVQTAVAVQGYIGLKVNFVQ